MNIIESLNRGLETKYHLNEAKEDKERFLSFINATIKDEVKSQSIVDNFDKLKSSGRIKGEEADYYYWIKNRTVNELQDFLDAFNTSLSKTQTKKQEKAGAELIDCSNKDWLIYKITTYDASKYYGEHTHWCITGRNGPDGIGAFNNYKDKGVKDYYFLWQKGNEKNGKWCYLDYGTELKLNNNYFYDAHDHSHTIAEVDIPAEVLSNLPGIPQKLATRVKERQEITAEVQKTGVYTYNSLDDNDFIRKLNPKKIVIPDNVKEIGEGAFSNCDYLQEINLPYSLERIGGNAFSCCTSLQEINIPNKVEEIGRGAFACCTSLQNINLPNSIEKIGQNAFFNCTSLQKIILPGSVKEIEDKVFDNCTSLKEINIPNMVKKIGSYAFYCCYSLQEIILPDSIKEIGWGVFHSCTSLQEIVIPNSIEKIGVDAFCDCPSLKEINLPNSVEYISDGAFAYCDSLREINLPNSIKEIDNRAFFYCDSLREINLPNSIKYIGNCAFTNCTSLQGINIHNSVKYIGERAFACCTSLQEINLPDSIEKVGGNAFYYCISLKEINIKGEYRPEIFKNAGLKSDMILNWIDCGIKETWGDILKTL